MIVLRSVRLADAVTSPPMHKLFEIKRKARLVMVQMTEHPIAVQSIGRRNYEHLLDSFCSKTQRRESLSDQMFIEYDD